MNLLMVIFFTLAINTKAPDYWTGQEAFKTVLGSTPRVLLASSLAFVIGGWADDRTFLKMKEKFPTSTKGFGVRAILSSVIGELVDSLIFLPIAFIGLMPIQTLVIMTITQVFIKTDFNAINDKILLENLNKTGKKETFFVFHSLDPHFSFTFFSGFILVTYNKSFFFTTSNS